MIQNNEGLYIPQVQVMRWWRKHWRYFHSYGIEITPTEKLEIAAKFYELKDAITLIKNYRFQHESGEDGLIVWERNYDNDSPPEGF